MVSACGLTGKQPHAGNDQQKNHKNEPEIKAGRVQHSIPRSSCRLIQNSTTVDPGTWVGALTRPSTHHTISTSHEFSKQLVPAQILTAISSHVLAPDLLLANSQGVDRSQCYHCHCALH